MVVAAVKNILLHLCVISNFILIGNKGLAHAQNCLKSAETVQVVKNCPENQREWEEAAQRKNCLVIQKYDNCSKVEYHCLVNEFRNETIEVCTNPKYLQGYCPHYNLNEARNDYTKKCLEYSYPCNCSSRYLSTEAYKLQCCFNGTNGDSREIPIDNNSDKNSNGLLGLWIVLGIVGLVGIVFLACVIYGIKRQNKPLCEALQIWRNISCKSPICACLSSGSEKDEHDNYRPLPNATTDDTIAQHGSEETSSLLGGREDNLNSVTNECPTSEEYNSKQETCPDSSAMEGNSNSAKPASHLTPVTNNPNSLTSEENDPKREATASQTQMAASSNFETYEEDDSKPEAISSEAAASVLSISNATSNSNEELMTDNNAPVMQVSDPRTEGLCHNPTAKCDDPLKAGNEMMTPTGIEVLPLPVRVKQLELDKEDLKKRLYPTYFGYMDLMIYEIKSTMQKIKAMERETSANPAVIMDKLKTKVTELEKSIQEKNTQLDELGLDLPGNDERSNSRRRHRPKTKVKETPTKLEKKSLVGIHVEYRSEEDNVQISNDNEQKKEGETLAEVETFSNPKRSTDVWVEPTTLASLDDSHIDNGDEECRFQKKTSCVQIDTAIKTFEDFREEYYESNPPADIKILEDRVSEVENDIKFLLEASRFIDSAERGKENKFDLINNSLKELNDNIDRLKKDFSFCFLENDLHSM